MDSTGEFMLQNFVSQSPCKRNDCATLRQQLAEAQAECLEQARIAGAGGERELALMAKLAEAQASRDQYKHDAEALLKISQTAADAMENLERQLAERDAQVAALVEAAYHRGYEEGYERRHLEVLGALT